jgi:(2R)-sulfolactate sulfo-lyase subunit beta
MTILSKDTTFLGYRRENGRVGVRNHVIVLPLDDLSNAAAEAVAHNVKGALAIPHPYGRLQFGADLDLHFRTLIGAGCNPNVAAVVVIGIEDGWTQKVVDGIKTTGKPVVGFGIEGHGDHDTIMRASKAAREYVQWASEKQREACPIAELWVSTKCGESDTTSGCGANPTVGNAFDKLHPLGSYLCFGETTELTGGEQIVAARCANDEVRQKFMFMFDRYQEVINRHKTSDLSDSQPTKGNIAGGLTTIEEKALGNIQKIGKVCTVDGVIDKAGDADPSGALVHGLVIGSGGDGDLVRGVRLCGALLPDRAGQRDRQPDPAGDQDLREPAHGAADERAHRRRHVGPAAARDQPRPGRRPVARVHAADRERAPHRSRGARPSRVRDDAAV